MFRLRFLSFIKKNLKYSTNVVSATGTGKYDFGPRKSFPAVGRCFNIVRCKSSEGSFYLLSEFDKYVVPLYDKKFMFNPVVTGWWTRINSLVINDIVQLAEPFLNNKLFRGEKFFKTLSSAVARTEPKKVLEKFGYGRKTIEASQNTKKKLSKINETRRYGSVVALVNTFYIGNLLKFSDTSAVAADDLLWSSNGRFINESYPCNVRLSCWPLSSVSLEESEFLDHRNRINYIKNKLLIPYAYLMDKLVGLKQKNYDFEADDFIKDEHFMDSAWVFNHLASSRKNIYSCVKEDIPKLISEWPSENQFTKDCLSSYNTSAVEIDVIKDIAKILNCDMECIRKYFANNVLKEKMAKKMLLILRLLRRYGITNKQIRQSIEILNYSPVVIHQRLRLLQDTSCGSVDVPSLLLRDSKFELYFKKLKTKISEFNDSTLRNETSLTGGGSTVIAISSSDYPVSC